MVVYFNMFHSVIGFTATQPFFVISEEANPENR